MKPSPRFLLFLIIIGYICYSTVLFYKNITPVIRFSPESNPWGDELFFLQTFRLVKSGLPYYQAVQQANDIDWRLNNSTSDPFTWRLPVVFYFWALFADNGTDIGKLFVILSSFSLIAGYFISRKYLNPYLSLLSPLILSLYFFDPFSFGPSFLFTEWWGYFPFIFGLWALAYNKKSIAAVFFTLAVVTRELFIIPVFFMFLVSLWHKKNRALFLKVIAFFCLFFSIHAAIIKQQPTVAVSANPLARIHSFSPLVFQKEVAFATRLYPLLSLRLPLLLLIAAAAAFLIKTAQKQPLSAYLLASFLPFAVISGFIGGPDNDYWGILFMPLAISLAPVVLSSPPTIAFR